MWVDLALIKAEIMDHGQSLRREGLIQLNRAQLVQRNARLGHGFFQRANGADAHNLSLAACLRPACDLSHRGLDGLRKGL